MTRTYLKLAGCCRSDINAERFGSRTNNGNVSGIIFRRRTLRPGIPYPHSIVSHARPPPL